MGERAKSLALMGAGILLGSASTLFLLRLMSRKVAIQRSENAIELNSNTKCHAVGEDPTSNHGMACADILSDDIVSEQLSRNIQFLGLESQHKVIGSYVVVIGLGGVGSHAASMLLRSGIGRLLLVDFDQVSLSSLNRHAVATRSDVGTPKASCLKEHFLSIFPECHIEAKVMLYDSSSEDEILSGHPDFVLDCIDNIDTKIVPGFRIRIIPVLGTIPAIFGQVMASYVVTQLAGLQIHTEPVVSLDLDHYRTLHQRLIEHEESLYGTSELVQVDVDEVMYVTKELWHGRSAREPFPKDVGRGMWRSVNELMLVRWDREKPASVSNLVLLKFKEVDEHESKTLDEIKAHEPEFFTSVSAVLKQAEEDFGLQHQ